MAELVTLRHPALPEWQTIRVPERGVAAREHAGWVRVETASGTSSRQPAEPVDTEPGESPDEEKE
ncbi:MAG TPA: hypothetical protein VG497_30800 [Kribbella sp.]|nr:hypothetical protein [Kribbella sp.]